ncbi:MAG: SAF domain-containing protein [Lachnospiraceae bacterium]|nr:SAF domain-containing protein [Lachnospiraceae bacterium]MBP5733713.1 SAF domain-containing protein [Lachnospiraceae bacterium]
MEQKKRQSNAMRAAKLWTGAILAAFLAAAAVYVALLEAEKNMLQSYEKTEVFVAAKEIPAGEVVTEENCAVYFSAEAVDAAVVPETAILTLNDVNGLIARALIEKGVVLTAGMFQPLDEVTAGMKEPVVAGFRADDLCQVVGGVLRAGDLIHVYSSEEEQGTFLIWENVYVQQVFDSKGTAIPNEDQATAAQRINVFLDKEDVEDFYSRLDQGTLRVVKVWRTPGRS